MTSRYAALTKSVESLDAHIADAQNERIPLDHPARFNFESAMFAQAQIVQARALALLADDLHYLAVRTR